MATMNINWKPGQSIIYAGTPIDEDGNIANNRNAVALVVSDTLNPNAAEVITEGTWDEETNYHGITISDDCKRALPGIEFVGSDGERHPATSLPTPKSNDAGKAAVVNEQENAYVLGAGGGGGGNDLLVTFNVGSPITCDKTYAEISSALEAGQSVRAFFDFGDEYPIYGWYSNKNDINDAHAFIAITSLGDRIRVFHAELVPDGTINAGMDDISYDE